MPREMFTDSVEHAPQSRKWAVLCSIFANLAVLLAVVVAPILATTVLPVPRFTMSYDVTPVQLPKAPPPAPKQRRQETRAVADPSIPPTEAPNGVVPEPPSSSLPREDEVETGGVVVGGEPLPEPEPPAPSPKPEVSRAPVVVGGNIKPPTRTQYTAPVYPTIAQSARVQGVVILQATISEDGRVVDAKVLRSIPLLDQAALDAVRQWVFTPTTLNGSPVSVIMTVTVNFTLQ